LWPKLSSTIFAEDPRRIQGPSEPDFCVTDLRMPHSVKNNIEEPKTPRLQN
jgi:hypothetical protein